jgi:hypothetical protein
MHSVWFLFITQIVELMQEHLTTDAVVIASGTALQGTRYTPRHCLRQYSCLIGVDVHSTCTVGSYVVVLMQLSTVLEHINMSPVCM